MNEPKFEDAPLCDDSCSPVCNRHATISTAIDAQTADVARRAADRKLVSHYYDSESEARKDASAANHGRGVYSGLPRKNERDPRRGQRGFYHGPSFGHRGGGGGFGLVVLVFVVLALAGMAGCGGGSDVQTMPDGGSCVVAGTFYGRCDGSCCGGCSEGTCL
jgi:hypothetical protein